jgi:hypothetical protein
MFRATKETHVSAHTEGDNQRLRTSILASISSASLSVHLLPVFWLRRQRSAKRVSELGRRRTRVTVFSGGLLSFEFSVELSWLHSSISTIMHPADGETVS